MKAEIYNLNTWVYETNSLILKNSYSELLGLSGFNILDFIEYNFKPQGYTALWLLGESHFAVHTFPEENKTYVELSSCNEEYFVFLKENIFYGNIKQAGNLKVYKS